MLYLSCTPAAASLLLLPSCFFHLYMLLCALFFAKVFIDAINSVAKVANWLRKIGVKHVLAVGRNQAGHRPTRASTE
jgi:formate-dependent nitrite reductase membrane component NrfD